MNPSWKHGSHTHSHTKDRKHRESTETQGRENTGKQEKMQKKSCHLMLLGYFEIAKV